MRRVEQIMGMPISIDIPGYENRAVFETAFNRLREIDEQFSTYKPDSEVSRFARDELSEEELSPELRSVITACQKAEEQTDGYFSAWAAGAFEPSGYVKGWAVAEAGKVIEKMGHKTFCIGAGGDILAQSDGDKTWNIGIQDPRDKQEILNPSTSSGQASILRIKDGAVCTSGSYERGSHIFNPNTKKPADKLLSVTVTGPDIITADVLATAVFAAGQKQPSFIKKFREYKIVAIV